MVEDNNNNLPLLPPLPANSLLMPSHDKGGGVRRVRDEVEVQVNSNSNSKVGVPVVLVVVVVVCGLGIMISRGLWALLRVEKWDR